MPSHPKRHAQPPTTIASPYARQPGMQVHPGLAHGVQQFDVVLCLRLQQSRQPRPGVCHSGNATVTCSVTENMVLWEQSHGRWHTLKW
jgi:aspartate carbamoyltransferase catalytic subunit